MNKMNILKKSENTANKNTVMRFKIKDLIILGGLAIVLVFASWKIFYTQDNKSILTNATTQTEEKVSKLLEEITGVGTADVMICETEEGVKSVVVVCEGGNDFQVIMSVRQAVAAALGTSEKSVKVYQKK